jgi:hypothetical protein
MENASSISVVSASSIEKAGTSRRASSRGVSTAGSGANPVPRGKSSKAKRRRK